MRKFLVLLTTMLLMLPFGFSQNRVTFSENFDKATHSFTSSSCSV